MRKQLIALAIATTLAAPASWATTHTIETIDFPGATSTDLSAINDEGRIVGSYTPPGETNPTGFTERNGVYTSIPFTLPCRPSGRCHTGFLTLNDRGVAAGAFSEEVDYPGLFTQKIGEDPVILQPPGYPTTAVQLAGLNDRGVLAGWYQDYSVETVPLRNFEVINGTFTLLSLPVPPGSDATIVGLNNWNQLIGSYYTDTGSQAFVYTGQSLQLLNLPAAWGGQNLYPVAINDFGMIIGNYNLPPDPDFATDHGFLMSHGTWLKIDFPGAARTQVSAINNRGEVLGTYNTSPSGGTATSHQFILVNGVYTDVSTFLPAGFSVVGLDNRGRLFGNYLADPACTISCAYRGFVATPAAD